MKKVAILPRPGVFDTSLAVTLDILSSAQRIHDEFCGGIVEVQVSLVGHGSDYVETGAGLQTPRLSAVGDVVAPDFVILPGLGINDSELLLKTLEDSNTLSVIDAFKRFYYLGATLATSCSGTFLFAEAGLFGDSEATTSWWLADAFSKRYPDVTLRADQILLVQDRLICAGAAFAQADLMMVIIGRLYGEETARMTAHYLLIDRRELQSRYVHSAMLTRRHPEMEKVERWIRRHLAENFTIVDLANGVGLSPRTLARRTNSAVGKAPLQFVRQLRLEHTIHMLETTNRSFEAIADDVGYQNSSSLRRLVFKSTGKRPSDFRRSFSHTVYPAQVLGAN